ncbi:30S ribosomal protein S5 [Borrelia sp. BU AG58]|uniref:30S ribosomal protein S5 n=1 Tax=Borrelia sp. BU AG58 TaxID=2887345 RepID=UPI001E3DB237|nr:30S ribosomal protein S5 [Borrelia sp. BU AG58]UER67663.1 30S ribosomal protein S5 [Borrelia sp. BU AG58]
MEAQGQKKQIEKLISLNRVTKVVKGGRRFSFAAFMVIGDGEGRVGWGFGKANDASDAIKKSSTNARKNLRFVPIKKGTLPHMVIGDFKKARVLIKPATEGTGIIAGGPVRAVMEAVGVHDILSKSLGSNNSMNVVKATFKAFDFVLDGRKVAEIRGKTLRTLWG